MASTGLVEAILKNCKDFLWETQPRGPGLLVHNAFTKQPQRVWICIIRLIEDTVGLPKPLCCRKQPAYVGMAPTLYCHHMTPSMLSSSTTGAITPQRYRCVSLVYPAWSPCGQDSCLPRRTVSGT